MPIEGRSLRMKTAADMVRGHRGDYGDDWLQPLRSRTGSTAVLKLPAAPIRPGLGQIGIIHTQKAVIFG